MPADFTPHLPLPGSESATRIVVLIFSDIVGSTALPAKFGAAPYAAALRLHNELFERLAAEESVTIVKFTGDGYFAWCPSAASAVRFALRFQQCMRDMAWGAVTLTTRLGIHLGEVSDITAAGRTDMIGSAANLASRLMSAGLGGQILLSRAPFDEGRLHVSAHPPCGDAPALALEWLAHGPYRFNGYDEPIEIFEVGAKGVAPLVPPPDAEKAKRALRPGDEETLGWRPAEGLEIPGRPGWRIAEKLGAGGFGEVWAGQHAKTRDRRAFKFCFDAERLRALKREVTLTRLLRETLGDREDIVRIFDLRLDAPPYFLESELATEGNLLQWAEKQGGLATIPLAERLELVAATAAALAAAHSVGVLHKDIKPTNVLIFTGKDGRSRPRLVDFGIGTLADSAVLAQHGITGAGFTGATIRHSSGTPTYSAPEYLAGRPFTVQGDVYSLGVMLWQLVTAKADQPLAEGWQRDVSDLLLREDIALCVDGDPARRLPSAAELATRLRALPERAAEAIRRAKAEAVDTARRERQSRLRFATAIATLIAAIAIPLAVRAVVKQREAEKEKANAQEQTRIAQIAEEKAKSQVREASRSDTATAQARLADGKWQEAVAYLGRAIRYDEGNRNAQDALWLALRHGKRDAGRLPVQVFPKDGKALDVSFSPDGTRVFTVNSDHTARVWNAKTGLSVGAHLQHEGHVHKAVFSQDGMRVATTSPDHTVRIWDAKTGVLIGQPLKHEYRINTAILSPDGSLVLTTCHDDKGDEPVQYGPGPYLDEVHCFVRIWDPKSGMPIGSPLNQKDGVQTANFSPDGSRILTANSDGTVRIWDAKTGTQVGLTIKHGNTIRQAIFSPDSSLILTAGQNIFPENSGEMIDLTRRSDIPRSAESPPPEKDHILRMWDAKTGLPVGPPLNHKESVRSVTFSPDGSRLATIDADETARMWDAKTGLKIWDAKIGLKTRHALSNYNFFSTSVFSPEGSRVALSSPDHTVSILDADTGLECFQPIKHEGYVTSMAFNSHISLLLITFGDTVRLWDLITGQQVGPPFTHDRDVTSATFSSDDTRVLTICSDHTAYVWDARAQIITGSPVSNGLEMYLATFSPDGVRVLTANHGSARIWNAKTGRQIGAPFEHDNDIVSSVFSPDCSRITTAGVDNTARIWDVKTGRQIGSSLQHEGEGWVHSATFSPDGTRVLTASDDKTARIWDANTGTQIAPSFQHESKVKTAIFSPDGTRILTVDEIDRTRIWDARTGLQINYGDEFDRAAFSPDGTRIVTIINDSSLATSVARVWDATTGLQIGAAVKDEDFFKVTFSPDGTRILVRSFNGSVRIWDVNTGLKVSFGHDFDLGGDASFSPDGSRILSIGSRRIFDTKFGMQIGPQLTQHGFAIRGATFSPDGTCILSSRLGDTTRIWDVKPGTPLSAVLAEMLTMFCSGAQLDPELGSLRQLTHLERRKLWVKLQLALVGAADWRFAAEQTFPQDPQTARVSPGMTLTLREASTRLLQSPYYEQIREAADSDPGHPLLPFACAEMEVRETGKYPTNPVRVAWLVDYGMKHLPADTARADLICAAGFVASVAEKAPAQKANGLLLLDRAVKLAPEDDQIRFLRERLK